MGIIPNTGSDCEVIIHLYLKYGIEQALIMLDGVFSFILYDNRISNDLNNKIYIARDPLGIRPLYYLKNKSNKNNNSKLYGFASELKCLENGLEYVVFKGGNLIRFKFASTKDICIASVSIRRLSAIIYKNLSFPDFIIGIRITELFI
jgi:asparagine synthetase B (glutamine-hydrolysing)